MASKFPQIETLQKFQVVFWDLDNTIYEYEPAHKVSLSAALKQFSDLFSCDVEICKEYYAVARKEINSRLHGQAASHSRLLYFKEMIQNIGSKKIAMALILEKTYWKTFLKNLEVNIEALTLIKKLHIKGIPQAIITDLTTQIQLQKLKQLKLEKYFSLVLSSEEAGIEKPNASIFEMAVAKMNVKAINCCMIGDNIKTDGGAEKIGMSVFIV
jgi:HAD superfamily hydrolase (TIGR01549 family)